MIDNTELLPAPLPSPATQLASIPTSPLQILQENKRILLAALIAAGVVAANIRYEGCGDSGGTEDMEITMAEGKTFDPSAPVSVFEREWTYVGREAFVAGVLQEVAIGDALRDFADSAIEQYHAGFENGDGGSGEVIFDCTAELVRIEHNAYYTDSEYTETEL